MEIREIKLAQLTGGSFNGGEGKYLSSLGTLNFNQKTLRMTKLYYKDLYLTPTPSPPLSVIRGQVLFQRCEKKHICGSVFSATARLEEKFCFTIYANANHSRPSSPLKSASNLKQ